jgi:hypothetical protein
MYDELKALEGVSVPSWYDAFSAWVGKTFTPSYQKEIDKYLNESVDHYDLERRMTRLIRRGLI